MTRLAFPKKTARKPRPNPSKDEKHLALIRRCQCLACLAEPAEAAHIRYADPSRNKPMTGMGLKPADRWAVPLCPSCHRDGPGAQHSMGERVFWEGHRIDPLEVAIELFRISTTCRERRADRQMTASVMRQVVRRYHNRRTM